MSSDIFDAYAKIAIQKKLVKNSDYKNDSEPRAGSDTIKVIEGLYGVKPKTQDYEHNIMEKAHKEKVIIAPSYDKINGLVENNNERQKIIINITQKPVNGHLTQHKYATQDLVLSLTKVANDMDNKDIEDLRLLADTCLEQLHKQSFDWKDITNFFKGTGDDAVDVIEGAGAGALIGGAIGGLVGVFGGPPGMVAGAATGAVLGAGISALFKTGPEAKNVAINAELARQKLSTLMTRGKVDDIFLQALYSALGHVIETANEYAQIIDQSRMPESNEVSKQKAQEIGAAYQKEIIRLSNMIETFLNNAKSGKYESKEDGEIWSKLKAPIELFTGNFVSDAVKALNTLDIVNDKALKSIEATRVEMAKIKDAPAIQMPQNNKNMFSEKDLADYEEALKNFH